MPEERFLTIQLHELLMYLGQQGVATILIGAHQGLIGSQMNTPVDASYLADAVVLLRYFEARGEVRQAISVMKKRGSKHERTIREFRLDGGRISVGEALRDFRGDSDRACRSTKGPPTRRRTRSARDEPGRARPRRPGAVLAPTRQGCRRITQALLSSAGIAGRDLREFERRSSASSERARPRSCFPRKRVSTRTARALRDVLAAQPPWSDLPGAGADPPGRGFRRARAKPSGRWGT